MCVCVCVCVCVVQKWNKLSQDVVDAMSVNQFKNRLDKFWRRYGHQKLGLISPSSDKYKCLFAEYIESKWSKGIVSRHTACSE